MNGIIRNALRVAALKKVVLPTLNAARTQENAARSIWSLSSKSNDSVHSGFLGSKNCNTCNGPCMCGCRQYATTKAEKDLVEFLAEEIVAEKQAQKLKTIPTELDGFKVSLDGAEVKLVKKSDGEIITVSFNINHTVDSEVDPEGEMLPTENEANEMKSKPSFNIDIKRGNQTLAFSCSFNREPGSSGASDEYNDIFGIDEIQMYEGDHTDNVYSVGGEIIDGYLYDLLMNYLEEKGISNEFAEKLVDLSTNYEHTAYISLLEGLSKFTTK